MEEQPEPSTSAGGGQVPPKDEEAKKKSNTYYHLVKVLKLLDTRLVTERKDVRDIMKLLQETIADLNKEIEDVTLIKDWAEMAVRFQQGTEESNQFPS